MGMSNEDNGQSITEKYKYKALDSNRTIRLLQLLPGAIDDPLRCNITHHRIDDVPKYRALSYTWGDSSENHRLACGEFHLTVGDNLAAALRCFQGDQRVKQCALWVDAVCINQRDDGEKEKQIALMSTIYRKADAVIIWLGQDRQASSTRAKHVNHHILRLKWALQSMLSSIELAALASFSTRANPKSLGAIKSRWTRVWTDLFKQMWFHRVWILQEATLASRLWVYHEGQALPWHYLGYIAQYFAEYHDGLATTTPLDYAVDVARNINVWRYHMPSESSSLIESMLEWGVLDGIRHVRCRRQLPSLIETLYESRHSLCSNKKDRIFGILGFVEPDEKITVQISYKLSIEEIFQALARYIIEKYQALDVLKYVEHPRPAQTLPSWVPNWSFKKYHNTNWRRLGVTGRMFERNNPDIQTSFRKYNNVASFAGDSATLIICGKVMETIDTVGVPYHSDEPYLDDFGHKNSVQSRGQHGREELSRTLQSWYQLMLDHPRAPPFARYIDGHRHFMGALRLAYIYNFSEAKLKGLLKVQWSIHNRLNFNQQLALRKSPNDYQREYELVPGRDSTDFHLQGFAWWTSQRDSVVSLVKRIRNTRLCITASGKLVVCPPYTGAGDKVVLIRGVRVPFILRPMDSNRYFVVGPCYIHDRIYTDDAWLDLENHQSLESFELV